MLLQVITLLKNYFLKGQVGFVPSPLRSGQRLNADDLALTFLYLAAKQAVAAGHWPLEGCFSEGWAGSVLSPLWGAAHCL